MISCCHSGMSIFDIFPSLVFGSLALWMSFDLFFHGSMAWGDVLEHDISLALCNLNAINAAAGNARILHCLCAGATGDCCCACAEAAEHFLRQCGPAAEPALQLCSAAESFHFLRSFISFSPVAFGPHFCLCFATNNHLLLYLA